MSLGLSLVDSCAASSVELSSFTPYSSRYTGAEPEAEPAEGEGAGLEAKRCETLPGARNDARASARKAAASGDRSSSSRAAAPAAEGVSGGSASPSPSAAPVGCSSSSSSCTASSPSSVCDTFFTFLTTFVAFFLLLGVAGPLPLLTVLPLVEASLALGAGLSGAAFLRAEVGRFGAGEAALLARGVTGARGGVATGRCTASILSGGAPISCALPFRAVCAQIMFGRHTTVAWVCTGLDPQAGRQPASASTHASASPI